MSNNLALRESEERFRLAMEATSDGLWDWEVATDKAYFSPAYFRMLGYQADELRMCGETWIKLIHPDDLKHALSINQDCIENRTSSFEVEFRMRGKDGSWKWIFGRGRAVTRDAQGRALRMIGTHTDITERKLADTALRESEERLALALAGANLGLWDLNILTGEVVTNNRLFEILGYRPGEVCFDLNFWKAAVHPEDVISATGNLQAHLAGAIPAHETEHRLKTKAGHYCWVLVRGRVTERDGEGKSVRIVGTMLDITDKKRAETDQQKLQAQLIQAQKMESVGRLAGGVAHDFNNMLTVILGNLSLALEDVPPNSPLYENLEDAQQCAQRSADLTLQLLAFARKQNIAPKVVNLNEAVEGTHKMLRRLIGEDIDLSWKPGACLPPVKVDPSQLGQILANLCVNARDAISSSGKVTIETGGVIFDAAYQDAHPNVVLGEYVLMSVSDSGCGMTEEVVKHIFEPFFTTKGVGKGTGLGLATIYGIVKQNKGFIGVYSKPGLGSTFKIYLPRYLAQGGANVMVQPPQPSQGAIVVVEDGSLIL